MAKLLKDESLVAKWNDFFIGHYKSDLETIAFSYPKTRNLYVDYVTIEKYETKLAEKLIEQPYKYIYNGEQALKEIDTATGKLELHFRIKNLPDTSKIAIGDLRSEHIGKIISVEGLVKKDTSVKANIFIGAFQCQKCGCIIHVEQDEDILKEPSECYEDQGGCGRVSNFHLVSNLSLFIDG